MSTLKARSAAPKVKRSADGHIGDAGKSSKKSWRERNDARIDRTGGPTVCHFGDYHIDAANGYPTTTYNGTKVTRVKAQWLDRHGADSIPDGMHVLHTCNDRECMNDGHQYLGTQQQNSLDAARAGTIGKRKLKADQARSIFIDHYRGGKKQKELAAIYGTTPANIRHILKRRTWVKATAELVKLMKPKKSARLSKSRTPQMELRV